jgi:hypothetical protein
MASLDPQVRTFEDLLSHLIRGEMSGGRTKEHPYIKEACLSAYNKIALKTQWDYYLKEYRILIDAPQSSSTITFDFTGGASERLLTIAAGTWPTWAKYGRIRIGNYVHDIYDRLSSTTLQLDSIMNPGEDVAALTTYVLYRSVYPLPEDFLSMYTPSLENTVWNTSYITPDEWLKRERFHRASGTPAVWTIMQNPDKTTDFAIFLDPPPDAAQPFSFIYRRRPRKIRWSGIETQALSYTLSGSAGASTLTTSTALPASMAGSIIRINGTILDASQPPDGLGGSNPFEEQHRILSISSTTVTLDGTTLDNTYSAGTTFRVSDPLDVAYDMIDALYSECRSMMTEFDGDLKLMEYRRNVAKEDVLTAMENQSRVDRRSTRGVSTQDYFRRGTVTQDDS